jgi:hypothetical protein
VNQIFIRYRLVISVLLCSGGPGMNFAGNKSLLSCGIVGVALVLSVYAALVDRLAPWEDELFVVSAGLSLARSGAPIESVLALYPQSDSPIRFYGPVSFVAEALLIRILGLSMMAWRLLCFAGVIFNLSVAIILVGLAGGDAWAQLIVALVLAISGFTAAMQPGRWDFVTAALFLGGVLAFLPAVEGGTRLHPWRAVLAGALLGCSLSSTPRALTLSLAAFVTISLLILFVPKVRKNLLLSSFITSSLALVMQNILLLPWRLTTFSWYAYVRKATKHDPKNATPITGTGGWGVDLDHHKTLVLVAICLFLASLCSAVAGLRSIRTNGNLLLRIFLGLFATINLFLMLLLTRGSLGLSGFWLTPVLIALMSWFDWRSLGASKLRIPAVTFIGLALLILLFQGGRQLAAVSLTWTRRSTENMTEFIRRSVPQNAIVYGPIDGYLYPVELAGRTYLYLYEQERQVIPWLPSNPHSDASIPVDQELDDQICASPTYVMWPVPDDLRQPLEEKMPRALLLRLGPKVAELSQPPLPEWKERVLRHIGRVGGKYGFPDVVLFQLRSSVGCTQKAVG